MKLNNPETCEQMKERLYRESFLRSLFWQGENGGEPPIPNADKRIQKHIADEQIRYMRLGYE